MIQEFSTCQDNVWPRVDEQQLHSYHLQRDQTQAEGDYPRRVVCAVVFTALSTPATNPDLGILPTLLDVVPLRVRQVMWLQHDRAPAHFDRDVRDHLDATYPNR